MPLNTEWMHACIKGTTCAALATAAMCGGVLAAEHGDKNALTAPFRSAQQEFAAAWSEQPLAFTAAEFVSAPARSYGEYVARPSSNFKPGEAIVVYAEPVGYGFRTERTGFTTDLSVDFELRNITGQILASQEGFAQLTNTNRHKIREMQTSLSFSLEGLQAGSYVLNLSFSDQVTGKEGSFSLPFEMNTAEAQ